jgi:hypothetical protein
MVRLKADPAYIVLEQIGDDGEVVGRVGGFRMMHDVAGDDAW